MTALYLILAAIFAAKAYTYFDRKQYTMSLLAGHITLFNLVFLTHGTQYFQTIIFIASIIAVITMSTGLIMIYRQKRKEEFNND